MVLLHEFDDNVAVVATGQFLLLCVHNNRNCPDSGKITRR